MRPLWSRFRSASELVLVVVSVTISGAVSFEALNGSTSLVHPSASQLALELNNSSGTLAPPALSVSSFGTWPMYDDNNLRTGAQSLERTLAPGNVSLLTAAPHFPFTANGSITGSAAVANGTAYFGTMNGHLYALNVTLGKVV